MVVSRPWFLKLARSPFPFGSLLVLSMSALLSSCNPTEISSSASSRNGMVSNNNGTLDGYAYVYKESPAILAGPNYSPAVANIANFVDRSPVLITTNNTLTANCTINFFYQYSNYTRSLPNCLAAVANSDQAQNLARNSDRTYIFTPGSAEFYQVNALYHVTSATDTFLKKLDFAFKRIQATSYTSAKSVPFYLKDSGMWWFKGVTSIDAQNFKNSFLTTYAQCNFADNAFFNPVGPSICMGYSSKYPNLFYVQDPSVVYHEYGHAAVSIMMNLRNADASSAHLFRSNLGNIGYDEAGSINEGIADYFSFVMNKRTHMGEWALGSVQQSRPMSEEDASHIDGIDTTSEGRLSYPQYLLYDPNVPNSPYEDVHYAGQITSHYLVALTKAFQTTCQASPEFSSLHDQATSYVVLLLAETLSELGDLNAKGVDGLYGPFSANLFFNNLDTTNSFLWTQFINPPTYRRFYQVFAKNINKYVTGSFYSPGLCPAFDINVSEKLLDDYGLLLFKNYNNNGNDTKSNRDIATKFYKDAVPTLENPSLTRVTENNRRKSVLVSKQLLNVATKTNNADTTVSTYIIDNRSDMANLLGELLFKGFPVPVSKDAASVDFNNGNIKVSPGEVVAIIPNLKNTSNSTMAGIEVLATDWDHVHITDTSTGNFKPCVLADDASTTVDQGGEAAQSCSSTLTENNRLVPARDPITNAVLRDSSGKRIFPSNAVAPVCMVQLEEGTSTRWVSQNEYREKKGLNLQDKDCLGYSSSNTVDSDFNFNPHECLMRFLPGANTASFSKIDSQKTYYETVVKPSSTKNFNPGNLLVMEVNKWIPPGTKFRCRLRARFSNCSDCYNDSRYNDDEYQDSELMGAKPFKVINLDLDIND